MHGGSCRHYRACRSSFSCGASGWVGMPWLGCRIVSVALDVVGCVVGCCLFGWRLRRRVFGDSWWAVSLVGSSRELRSLCPVGTAHCFPFLPFVVVLHALQHHASSTTTSFSSAFFFNMFCPLSALPLSLPPIVFIFLIHVLHL